MCHDLQPLIDSLFTQRTTREVLDNGLLLLHRKASLSDVVTVQVWVKTGSIHEGELLGCGVSHFLEHMLFKGTERRSATDISREVHAMGGMVNAYTSFDRTVYHIDCPSAAFEQALDVLADQVLHSQLDAEEVAREKNVILREIDMFNDDPDRRMMQALFSTAFLKHPYRYPILGHRELFESVSRDELSSYYESRYSVDNLMLVVAGAVSEERVKAAAQAAFGAEQRKRLSNPLVPDEPTQFGRRDLHEAGDYEIERGQLAYKIPRIGHEDSPALDALAYAMGGGQSSLLWQRLREEKQLVHYIDASTWCPGNQGLFWISYTCDPGKRLAVEAAIQEAIDHVLEHNFSEATLHKVVRQTVANEVNSRKTTRGLASRIGICEYVLGCVDYGKHYLEELAALTPARINEVCSKYLNQRRVTSTSLVPGVKPDCMERGESGIALPADFEEVRLKNGVRVLLQPESRLPRVHLRAAMLGGPFAEAPEKRGVSSLLATMLLRDTEKRSGAEVAELIESVGGSMTEVSGNNTIGFGFEVLPLDSELAVELAADALLRPTFKQETLEIEREAQLADIREAHDDILDYSRSLLRKKFFGDYPLADDSSGRLETVATLSREDLVALHRQLVVGDNLVLAVSGMFDRDEMLARLERAFGNVPAGEAPAVQYPMPQVAQPGEHVEVRERDQTIVLHGYPGVGVNDEERYVAEVLDEVYSGMSSRLFEEVRERRGLAYFVGSARVMGTHDGMFYFYSGTSAENAATVSQEFDKEVARVASGKLDAAELERCRTRLKAGKKMSLQAPGTRAMAAALNSLYGQPVDEWRHYDAHIDAVTAERVAAFARKHLVADKRVALVVKPKE